MFWFCLFPCVWVCVQHVKFFPACRCSSIGCPWYPQRLHSGRTRRIEKWRWRRTGGDWEEGSHKKTMKSKGVCNHFQTKQPPEPKNPQKTMEFSAEIRQEKNNTKRTKIKKNRKTQKKRWKVRELTPFSNKTTAGAKKRQKNIKFPAANPPEKKKKTTPKRLKTTKIAKHKKNDEK